MQSLFQVAAVALVLGWDWRPAQVPAGPNIIAGPMASLLAASTDLGPAHSKQVHLTDALPDHLRPDALTGWTEKHGLSLRWRPGDDWAIVQGAPHKIADAFGVVAALAALTAFLGVGLACALALPSPHAHAQRAEMTHA